MTVRVNVEKRDVRPFLNPIGFVDPGERITFSYPLKLGRWYLKIIAYAPDTSVKHFESTLYVKQNQNAYIYEIHNSDFSNHSIPTLPSVSIVGTWVGIPGFAIQFQRKGDEYIGTLVAVPDSMTKFGLYSGLEWIKLERTNFNQYKGIRIQFDTDQGETEIRFSCMVKKGNELFPHNWTRKSR